jgi:DNA-binding IclR family transcriptional regulator
MNNWKEKVWKSRMVIEAIANAHKGTGRRARPPDPRELLDQLDTVDLRLLQWLLRYPFQRSEDLALAIGSSSATVYRHLNVLHENGLVERVMPPALGMAKCWLYHLSNLGLQVLAVHKLADPVDLARTWSTDESSLLRLLPRLGSLITLQECLNGLVTHAPEALAPLGRRSEVRWHWMRDYSHRFPYREKLMRCTADAALLLRVRTITEDGMGSQEQWYSLFVLLDVEIARDTWLKQRLARLLCYRESAERWPVYQHFPPVLVLVSTSRRMEHWQQCAVEAATALHVAKLSGVIACVPKNQQMTSYNPWRFAWKTLATKGPCTIQQQLHPLPIEAISPGLWDHARTDRVIAGKTLTDDGTAITKLAPTRKRTRIIVGNYMDRVNDVQKDHTSDSPDEREIMALLGLSLGQRHLELFTLLFTHPLLALHEIAALLDLEVSSIERYLGMLRSIGCIVPIRTDAGQRWRLCERGLRLIAATHHINVQRIAIHQESDAGVKLVQQGVDVLFRHLEHTAGIYGFFASLSQAASRERRQGREHRLLWWETGMACERRYHDHDRWHNLRPDAFAEYQAGERRVRFWLEWDCGTMSSRDLAIKFRTYAHYVASREWFKQEAWLPLLLVVTPDPEQERRLCRVAIATLTDNCGVAVRTTTLTRVHEQGLLGPIWDQILPYCEGTDLMPRRTLYL